MRVFAFIYFTIFALVDTIMSSKIVGAFTSNIGSYASNKKSFNILGRTNTLTFYSSHEPSSSSSSILILNMARGKIPLINEWEILKSGEIYGAISNHPTIQDGDIITTSTLSNPSECAENAVVTTISGSKYKLLDASPRMKKLLEKRDRNDKFSPLAKLELPKSTLKAMEFKELGLSGKSVGNGKYLLAGKPLRSTSGKSQIWTAYKTDLVGNPVVAEKEIIKVKITPNMEAISRENKNYDRVTGLFSNRKFVKKYDFFEDAGLGFEKQSAIVMQGGEKDLKGLLIQRKGVGFDGKALRDGAVVAAQCIQDMHSARLVWTDLKSENFIITGSNNLDEIYDDDILTRMRGIDLESAIPHGNTPVDYSPEACPPEFASAFVKGEATDFQLDYSYDMWSFGMFLYEMNTGRSYFENKSPITITKALQNPKFRADVSKVEDPKLRDLIESCLDVNPDNRPNIAQVLIHPFFTTSGIGPISF